MSIRSAVGAVYQTVTLLLGEDRVPAVGVELLLVDDRGHAVHERRDDAVGRAGDPAGVGGAPEDVVGVQVEGVAAGRVVGDDRLVHVHGALGRAGRAAGEVQQRQVLGPVRGDLASRAPRAASSAARSSVPGLGRRRVDEQHVLAGRAAASRIGATFLPVERPRRDQHPPAAEVQPLADRLGAERGEQRAEDGAVVAACRGRRRRARGCGRAARTRARRAGRRGRAARRRSGRSVRRARRS